jgi:hypothetical protein
MKIQKVKAKNKNANRGSISCQSYFFINLFILPHLEPIGSWIFMFLLVLNLYVNCVYKMMVQPK